MDYAITESAQKLMDEEGIALSDLPESPINGKKFTKQDILHILDMRQEALSREEQTQTSILEEDVQVEPASEVAPPPSAYPDPVKGPDPAPLPEVPKEKERVEIFWKDRAEATALVKTGRYLITEVIPIKNAPWGVHKKLILKKIR